MYVRLDILSLAILLVDVFSVASPVQIRFGVAHRELVCCPMPVLRVVDLPLKGLQLLFQWRDVLVVMRLLCEVHSCVLLLELQPLRFQLRALGFELMLLLRTVQFGVDRFHLAPVQRGVETSGMQAGIGVIEVCHALGEGRGKATKKDRPSGQEGSLQLHCGVDALVLKSEL